MNTNARRYGWPVALVLSITAFYICARRPELWGGMVAAGACEAAIVVYLWTTDSLRLRTILLVALGARILLFALPPVLSDDIFRYLWDGHLLADGINPYLLVPSDWMATAASSPGAPEAATHLHPPEGRISDRLLFNRMNSTDYYSIYPPVSQGIFWIGAEAAQFLSTAAGRAPSPSMHWTLQYYVTKGLFAALEAAGVLLLSRLIERRWLLLYALHPLVLLEAAGQGHTEAAMVFFLILTLWAVRRSHPHVAAAALACAGWVKLYPLVLFPFLFRRFRWRALPAAAGVTLLVWIPFWNPQVPANMLESLSLYVQLFEFNAGPYYALKGLLYAATGHDWSKWLGPALQIVFLMVLPLIYWQSASRRWSFATASYVTLGAFFLLSTTVHPWYLLGLLVFAAARERAAWHWQWAAAASIASYLFYSGVPFVPLVLVVWGGWLMVLVATSDSLRTLMPGAPGSVGHTSTSGRTSPPRAARKRVLRRRIMRWRGRQKAAWIGKHIARGADHTLRILDLGAGEGYVGEALARQAGAEVELLDTVDFREASRSDVGLPFRTYDGRSLPYDDDSFDTIILSFVLHHAEDPVRLLRESRRVANRSVIVLESIYKNPLHHRFMRLADRLANRIRSSGEMRAQEEHLHFRTEAEWKTMFEMLGYAITSASRRGRFFHPQVLFELDPTQRRTDIPSTS